MKLIFSLTALFLAGNAFAAQVNTASLDPVKNAIEIEVTYGGGCKEHKFDLKVGACIETSPVQCVATLVDLTDNDVCRALVTKKITIYLKDVGLTESYYSQAAIVIKGDHDSRASVRLPNM